jgi:hypothetical protein
MVPTVRTTRLVVMSWKGRRVKRIQAGVTKIILVSKAVNAGLVVAEVAVRWVDRKSVSSRRGSNKILHRVVNSLKASTISSKVLLCGDELSEACFR